MKKIVFSAIAMLALVGCGDFTGDTVSGDTYTGDYTYVEGGIDYGTGTVLQCDDSNCSVMRDESGQITSNKEDGDAVVGEYDDSYTPVECRAAGFFYCTAQDKCLNQRVDDSSSSCK